MSLNEALHILASIHTRDDSQVGFCVMAGAQWRPHEYQWSQDQYIEAWKVVREHVHMPVDPAN